MFVVVLLTLLICCIIKMRQRLLEDVGSSLFLGNFTLHHMRFFECCPLLKIYQLAVFWIMWFSVLSFSEMGASSKGTVAGYY